MRRRKAFYGPPSEDDTYFYTVPRLGPAPSARGQAWAELRSAFSARIQGLRFGAELRSAFSAPIQGLRFWTELRSAFSAPIQGLRFGAELRSAFSAPIQGLRFWTELRSAFSAPIQGLRFGAELRSAFSAPIKGLRFWAELRSAFSAPIQGLRFSALCIALFLSTTFTASADGKVYEIARDHSWVSPYWGYSAPKIVFDGERYFTPLLWGDAPEKSSWSIATFREGKWEEGKRHAGVYQPPVLLLDSAKRLIVIYNLEEKPAVILRAKSPGTADDFETIAPPKDMANAYYIGAAIRNETIWLAYINIPDYSMRLSTLDIKTNSWSPAVMLAKGQIETKPKTAWTYPVLEPAEDGLHIVASNAPDGGDGNTYNQVWHVFVPNAPDKPMSRELVEEGPMGHLTYATDFAIDAEGALHIVYMAKSRKYGDPEPLEGPSLVHAWKQPDEKEWRKERAGKLCVAAFYQSDNSFHLIRQEDGSILSENWNAATMKFEDVAPLVLAKDAPAAPYFMDVIRTASGSVMPKGVALVTSGVLPPKDGKPDTTLVWSFLPN
jgi:hypothetical protein